MTYPADPGPARAGGRPGGAIVERRRLLDDQRDLRRRSRPGRGAAARGRAPGSRSRGSCPPGAVPELAPDAAGDRPDLLVHASKAAGSTWAGCARSRTGTSGPSSARSRAWRRSSSVGGFPIEYEVAPDPDRLRLFGVTLKDVVEAVAASNAAAGGHVRPQGERRVRGAGRRLAGRLADARRRVVRRRAAPFATWRTCVAAAAGRRDDPARRGRRGRDRARLSPRRAGEGRQRGHRRRGPDGPRREPARGHAPDQGEDPRAASRPAARAFGSSRSTTGRR